MNVVDKLYTEWAWRSKSGTPNLNNPEDKAVLDTLLRELEVKEEPIIFEGSVSYDSVIKEKLGEKKLLTPEGEIPRSNVAYKFTGQGGSSFNENVRTVDKPIWEALWEVKPKAKSTGKGSLGVGNGEVALYWLYNYSRSNVQVEEERVGGGADLSFDGVGVEVKAEKSATAQIGLGRFSEFKEELSILTILFGLSALTKVLSPKDLEGKIVNPTSFLGTELPGAFESFKTFAELPNLQGLASQFSIFDSIYQNVQIISKFVEGNTDPNKAAGIAMVKLLKKKLGIKPEFGGFLVNIKPDGHLAFWQIDKSKLDNYENVLNHTTVTGSKIKLNYSKIFG